MQIKITDTGKNNQVGIASTADGAANLSVQIIGNHNHLVIGPGARLAGLIESAACQLRLRRNFLGPVWQRGRAFAKYVSIRIQSKRNITRPGASTPVLVLGMSHVQAIDRALTAAERQVISVIDLNAAPDLFNKTANRINLGLLPVAGVTHVFLSIRGNDHNILGLIESPLPVRIGDGPMGSIPADPGRHFIPEDMMRSLMRARLEDQSFGLMQDLARHFSAATICQLASPPPCGDAAHIAKFPGIFRSLLHQGVSPMPLRRKIYDLHTELYQAACQKLGIGFIRPPQVAVAPDGAMKAEYWNSDPTHGNAAYGRLVIDQIVATAGVSM